PHFLPLAPPPLKIMYRRRSGTPRSGYGCAMTADLTVGLIGCGNWGRHILRDLRSLGCDVHVVAPSDASRDTARSLGAATIVPSLDLLPAVAGTAPSRSRGYATRLAGDGTMRRSS